MKRIRIMALFLATSSVLVSCDLVEGIFKAGMVWALFLVVLVVALIFWLIRKMRG